MIEKLKPSVPTTVAVLSEGALPRGLRSGSSTGRFVPDPRSPAGEPCATLG